MGARLVAEDEANDEDDSMYDDAGDEDPDDTGDEYQDEGGDESEQEFDESVDEGDGSVDEQPSPAAAQPAQPARSFQFVPPQMQTPAATPAAPPTTPGDEPFDFSRVQVQHVQQPSPRAATTLRLPSFNDIDRLWDWCRTDRDAVQAFFGWMPQRSIDLQHAIANLQQHETNGLAWFRSIDGPPLGQSLITHHGFVSLFPIDRQGPHPVGAVHIYLAPEARGLVQQYLPYLLAAADRDLPGVGLTIFADRSEWARLLVPLGFRAQVLLTRAPRNGNGQGG